MKKPNVGDEAYCQGHIKLYGIFLVVKVLPQKPTILGYACEGIYTELSTGTSTKNERFVRWSQKNKEWRT